MSRKTFADFQLTTTPSSADYIIGYNASGTTENRYQLSSIVTLISGVATALERDQQTLSFNTSAFLLTITGGNTVSLSSIVGIQGLQGNTGSQGLQGNTGLQGLQGLQGNTGSTGASGIGIQGLQGLQGLLGLQGTTGNNTDTGVRAITGSFIRSSSTLETPTTGISAVSNIVFLNQSTYNNLTVKLPTTMYVIVSA